MTEKEARDTVNKVSGEAAASAVSQIRPSSEQVMKISLDKINQSTDPFQLEDFRKRIKTSGVYSPAQKQILNGAIDARIKKYANGEAEQKRFIRQRNSSPKEIFKLVADEPMGKKTQICIIRFIAGALINSGQSILNSAKKWPPLLKQANQRTATQCWNLWQFICRAIRKKSLTLKRNLRGYRCWKTGRLHPQGLTIGEYKSGKLDAKYGGRNRPAHVLRFADLAQIQKTAGQNSASLNRRGYEGNLVLTGDIKAFQTQRSLKDIILFSKRIKDKRGSRYQHAGEI